MRTRHTYQTYYQEIGRLTREKLDKEAPDDLLQVDVNEYLNYLVEGAKREPLLWDESQKTIERFSTKQQRWDKFSKGYYPVDEERLRLRIPISNHPQREAYFWLVPSISPSEPDWKFEGDMLVHEVEATEQAVQEGLEAIRFWLGNRNKEIETGNKQLREHIRPVWEAKRKQLEERRGATTALLQKLNIPLHQDPNAKAKP